MHPMFSLEKVIYYFLDYQGLAFAYSFWHDQMEEMISILYVIAGYRKITWTPLQNSSLRSRFIASEFTLSV